ncbi:MAG: branched-chain amino acid transporter [Gammaproteobacteria bacterium]|nr:branched-chain amino acid transporter [Gammaproteobacteria bacterium]
MSDTGYLIAIIIVMAAATFLTRVIPFILLRRMADHPLLLFLGRYTPPAIMTILVLYSLQNLNFTTPPFGAVELIAIFLTTTLHVWLRHPLLSIFAGTGFYMAAMQSGVLS